MPDKSVEIFLISETKLDNLFLSAKFKMEDFTTPFMYDRNDKGGGLLLYIGGWGVGGHSITFIAK